jgi:CRP-like cAMP-binding protein
MDIDVLNSLQQCKLFKGLEGDEIIELMHAVRYRIVHYRKGELFALAGTVCQHADIIISGEMAAHMMSPSGRELRMSLHHSGNMLAPAFLFSKENQYPVTVEAVTDSRVLRLLPSDMEILLQADHRICMNFIGILSTVVSFLTKKVSLLSMSIREKVCFYLKEQIHEQQTLDLCLPMSRQQMAEHFGIQKYSLQRCLNELQEEGIIELKGKTVYVKDRKRLDN